MPQAGQPVLDSPDKCDRREEDGHIPRPRQTPRGPMLCEPDCPADYDEQRQILQDQVEQIRKVVRLSELHDLTLKLCVLERRPAHSRVSDPQPRWLFTHKIL